MTDFINGCDIIRVEYLTQCKTYKKYLAKSIFKKYLPFVKILFIQKYLEDTIDKIGLLSCIFKIKILSSREYLAQH